MSHIPALPSLLNPLYAPRRRMTRRDELRAWFLCFDRGRAHSLALARRPDPWERPAPAPVARVESDDRLIAERVAA